MELETREARNTDLSVRLQSYEAEVERLRVKKEAGFTRLREDYLRQLRAQAAKLEKAAKLGRKQAYAAWCRDQRREVFLSPQGQLFLDTLVHGVLQAYRRTPQFLVDFDEGICFLVEESGRKALDLVDATPEQRAKLDTAKLIDALDSEGMYWVAGIDMTIPDDSEEWIFPALDKALRGFVDGDDSLPLPEKPPWPISSALQQ